MKRFINSIKMSLHSKNWYGALSMALVLPDICGNIESPSASSKACYVDWYNRYLLKRYTRPKGRENKPHIFLCGEDCYALRCSYLHEGSHDIEKQIASRIIKSFHFITPPPGIIVYMNQKGEVLQLQVDIFCDDVRGAVEEWQDDKVKGNPELENRLNELLVIHDSRGGIIF